MWKVLLSYNFYFSFFCTCIKYTISGCLNSLLKLNCLETSKSWFLTFLFVQVILCIKYSTFIFSLVKFYFINYSFTFSKNPFTIFGEIYCKSKIMLIRNFVKHMQYLLWVLFQKFSVIKNPHKFLWIAKLLFKSERESYRSMC